MQNAPTSSDSECESRRQLQLWTNCSKSLLARRRAFNLHHRASSWLFRRQLQEYQTENNRSCSQAGQRMRWMQIWLKQWLQSCWRVALLTLWLGNNQWTICSRSETDGTLLCLSLQAPQLVDASHLHHRLGTVLRTLLKGNPDLRGPHSPNTLLTQTGEPLSFPARQQHLFVLYRQSPMPNRTNTPSLRQWCSSEEGVGRRRASNATQSPLCRSRTKEPVRAQKWEWDG